jgi:hypothetical protein
VPPEYCSIIRPIVFDVSFQLAIKVYVSKPDVKGEFVVSRKCVDPLYVISVPEMVG